MGAEADDIAGLLPDRVEPASIACRQSGAALCIAISAHPLNLIWLLRKRPATGVTNYRTTGVEGAGQIITPHLSSTKYYNR